MELSMKDYQSPDTMTHKMHYLPPSNKKEFHVKVNGEPFLVDTGLDPNITMKVIQKLQARQKHIEQLQEKEQTMTF
jgi:hypothetical protein